MYRESFLALLKESQLSFLTVFRWVPVPLQGRRWPDGANYKTVMERIKRL